MIRIRKKDERGGAHIDWLRSKHSFSFADYYDPAHMGFGPLRVINEDWVSPDSGFGMHGHKNMEIITYVLSGELTHQDSLGTHGTIRPGEVQVMSAGKGILHSEMNESPADTVHLLQIWIMPDENGTKPGYQQKTFAPEEMQNRLRAIVSKSGDNGALLMKQDATVFAAKIDAGKSVSTPMDATRKYWLQIARGAVTVGDKALTNGDGLAIEKEAGTLNITATENAEVLLFDLPV